MTVKVRYADRTTITRSHTVGAPVDSPRAVSAVAQALLDAVEVSDGVRLLGVSVSGLRAARGTVRQLSFDDADVPFPAPASRHGSDALPMTSVGEAPQRAEAWAEVEAAVSAIRARYGNASVGPGTLVSRGGIAVKERGDTQWGPSAPSPDDGAEP